MRLFVRLRDIGVAGQDTATVRRLRTVNLIAVIGCVVTACYCAFYLTYDAVLFRREIVFLFLMTGLYASVPLATRTGRVEAATWLLIAVAITHIGIINWLLGPRAGALSYLLATPFVISLILRDGDRISIWPLGIVASVIFVAITFDGRATPFDTLPEATQRLFFFINILGAVVIAVSVALFYRWLIARAEADLMAEKARGDRLLRAILPEPVAEMLKADESRVIAERYADATVLFADIVGFTERAARTDADRLVEDLNVVFSRIDALAAARGVEKIKTIGDAYFAVCGLPAAVPDHAARMADFALDLRAAADELAATVWPGLGFRTVLHSGPVVAGVIGKSKFAYDVWGDTVNTAARMEAVCAPGEILLTAQTRTDLPDRFETETLGPIDLRDKGAVQTYRLTGRRGA